MGNRFKDIVRDSFYELLIVYCVIVFLISISLLYRYTLHFEILALILAVFGIILLYNQKEEKELKINKKLHYTLLGLAIIFIIVFRVIPYINNNIPLGYDSGIYKYGIEHGLTNLDKWVVSGGFEPGFLYLMKPISYVFSSQFILTYFLIFISVLLGLGIYLCTKEFFNKESALIAILIFSLSIIQLKTFTYMYFKNILGLAILMFSLYFLAKYEKNKKMIYIILFAMLAGTLAGIHRPTFYIFGLAYFVYAFINPIQKENKKYSLKTMFFNIFIGVIILVIGASFYIGVFSPAITSMIEPTLQGFTNPGEAAGTFISFTSYQFLTLAYIPFAIIGFFIAFKQRKLNVLWFWLLINSAIVYFQFFFFNRFLIHLDIVLIIFASVGFLKLIENKKRFGTIILIIMLVSAGILITKESIDSKPLIDKSELATIQYLENTPNDSFIMTTSSIYSPFVLGYSQRKTIAPGLFDYNKGNRQDWNDFWNSKNLTEVKSFMNNYQKPLYIFIGKQQSDNLKNFTECFKIYYENSGNRIYEYTCDKEENRILHAQ